MYIVSCRIYIILLYFIVGIRVDSNNARRLRQKREERSHRQRVFCHRRRRREMGSSILLSIRVHNEKYPVFGFWTGGGGAGRASGGGFICPDEGGQ